MVADLTAIVLAAAADPTIEDRHLWALEQALRVDAVARDLELIATAKPFVATVVAVVRVKADVGAPGKARITLEARNGDREDIETDWLYPGSLAKAVARRAHGLAGKPALVFKANQEDPAGKVPQGFRRVVWIEAAP